MSDRRGAEAIASKLLLMLLASLAFMQPTMQVLGLAAVPTDFVFLACAVAWVAAVITGRTRIVWHPAYALLAFYFVAMLASAVATRAPQSPAKLATQLYLLALPVLVCNLVRSEQDMRAALR